MTKASQHLRVLLVEDDDALRNLVAQQLWQLGHEVTVAEHGAQALALAVEGDQAFDLVLMDMQMPVLDGQEATRRLREHPKTRELPVLVVSATDTMEGMRAGGDHFLQKPYDKKQLAAAVEQTLKMRTQSAAGGEG